jgi:NAD(P)-dependent dehydrogenase (short-subunit alcohol dehydrogenase family)
MASDSKRPVAVVIGVGAGTGAALARRFAKGYRVAMLARTEDYLVKLAKEIAAEGGEAFPIPANIGSAEEIKSAFDRIRRELDAPEVLLFNAAMRPFGRLMETKPSTFENTWRVSTFGAFLAAQEVVPDMIKRGKGVILFTGATAGVKPFATSAAFGPAKFALRGLAQVMARDLGPHHIHVAYINIDGPIDMPFIRQRVPNIQEEDMLKPSAIAETYWHLAHQDPSAWTQELDVRPFKEKF